MERSSFFLRLNRPWRTFGALLTGWMLVGCDENGNQVQTKEAGEGEPIAKSEKEPDAGHLSKGARIASGGGGKVPPKKAGRAIAPAQLSKDQMSLVAGYLDRLQAGHSSAEGEEAIELGGRETTDLLAMLKSESGDGNRIAALVELGGRDEVAALDYLRDLAAGDRPVEERVAALEALAEIPQVAHLPTVASALDAMDEEVRSAGVWLLTQIHADAALPLWQRVMSDGAAELVELAFEALPDAPEGLQVEAAATALRRGEPWITEQALLALGGITSKGSVEALIPMVDHMTSGDLAHDGLMFLIGESFANSSEARRWWRANKNRLDHTLQPLELAAPATETRKKRVE